MAGRQVMPVSGTWHVMYLTSLSLLESDKQQRWENKVKQLKADEMAGGFRDLANFLEDNATFLPDDISVDVSSWLYHRYNQEITPKEQVALVARAAFGTEAKIAKEYNDFSFKLRLTFGPVGYTVSSRREEVCTATVTGTENYEVEERVGEDDRPLETVTKTRDVVEWKCDPILDRLVD